MKKTLSDDLAEAEREAFVTTLMLCQIAIEGYLHKLHPPEEIHRQLKGTHHRLTEVLRPYRVVN
jgi:hypothetical protein